MTPPVSATYTTNGTDRVSLTFTGADGDVETITASVSMSGENPYQSLSSFAQQVATFLGTVLDEAPTVTSVTPASGDAAGGTSLTIRGTRFQDGATVAIGGQAATDVVVVDGTSITCVSPALVAGTYDVVVTNPGATASNAFTTS